MNLEVGSHSHAVQTARVMERLEPVIQSERPDWVVVYGDVNSTVAAVLVAAKLGVPSAHVEAGLRSDDRRMPEEINRIVADRLGSLLLAPSRDAEVALRGEGEPQDEIVFVGNVMIDSMLHALPRARSTMSPWRIGDVRPVAVTLHCPSNVDDPARLAAVADALTALATEHPVVFPVHPRTREKLKANGVSLRGVTADRSAWLCGHAGACRYCTRSNHGLWRPSRGNDGSRCAMLYGTRDDRAPDHCDRRDEYNGVGSCLSRAASG